MSEETSKKKIDLKDISKVKEHFFDSSLVNYYQYYFLDNYKFIIPAYQRSYVWQKDDLDRFWDLLIETGDDEMLDPNYLGNTIVTKEQVKDKKYHLLDVVDGQQRLTTSLILLSVLRDVVVSFTKNLKYGMNEMGELRSRIEKSLNNLEDGNKFEIAEKQHGSDGLFSAIFLPQKDELIIDKLEAALSSSKNESLKRIVDAYYHFQLLVLQKLILDSEDTVKGKGRLKSSLDALIGMLKLLEDARSKKQVCTVGGTLSADQKADLLIGFQINAIIEYLKNSKDIDLETIYFKLETVDGSTFTGQTKDTKCYREFKAIEDDLSRNIKMQIVDEFWSTVDNGLSANFISWLQGHFEPLRSSGKITGISINADNSSSFKDKPFDLFTEELKGMYEKVIDSFKMTYVSVLEVKSKDLAQDIYESVNSYGRSLTTTQMFKKRFIQLCSTINEEDVKWSDLIDNFDKETRFKTFLQYSWCAFDGVRLGDKELYGGIQKGLTKAANDLGNKEEAEKDFANKLLSYARIFTFAGKLNNDPKKSFLTTDNDQDVFQEDRAESISFLTVLKKNNDKDKDWTEDQKKILGDLFVGLWYLQSLRSEQWLIWYLLFLDELTWIADNDIKELKKNWTELNELFTEAAKLSWLILHPFDLKAQQYLPFCEGFCAQYRNKIKVNGVYTALQRIEALKECFNSMSGKMYSRISLGKNVGKKVIIKTTEKEKRLIKDLDLVGQTRGILENTSYDGDQRDRALMKRLLFEIDKSSISLESIGEYQLDHIFPRNPDAKALAANGMKLDPKEYEQDLFNGDKSGQTFGNMKIFHKELNGKRNKTNKLPVSDEVRQLYNTSPVKSDKQLNKDLDYSFKIKTGVVLNASPEKFKEFIDKRKCEVIDTILREHFGFEIPPIQ